MLRRLAILGKSLARVIRGPTGRWDPELELAYYRIGPDQVAAALDRQRRWEDEANTLGLQVCKNVGICRRSQVGGLSVLDFGAGESVLALALAKHYGARVVAVDAIPMQLGAAGFHHRDGPVRFVLGDGVTLPFQTGAFDLVVANLVLHHLPDLEGALSEIARVLKPGAEFRAFEPNWIVDLVKRHDGSDNEGPLRTSFVRRAMSRVGLDVTETCGWWSTGQTARLGPLSPGMRIVARREAGSLPDRATPALQTSAVPGLLRVPQLSSGVERQLLELGRLLPQS